MEDTQFGMAADFVGVSIVGGVPNINVEYTDDYAGDYTIQIKKNGTLYVCNNCLVTNIINGTYRIMLTKKEEKHV